MSSIVQQILRIVSGWTPKKWVLLVSSLSFLLLVVHYNVMKRRKAPIDFVVDKCVRESTNGRPPKKIVLIHGWPDNTSLWKYQIPELTKKYDCYRITLPNFDMRAKNYEGVHSWGYDLDEVAKSVNECVATQILSDKKEKVTLMIHDWGSVIGYLAYKFDTNNMYERIVSVDIGDHIGIDGLSSFLAVISYQWFNSICFLLPRFIGDIFNRFVPYLAQSPLVKENKVSEIHAGMNYLYFYLWWRLLTGSAKEISIKKGSIFTVPFLFFYGDKTPFKFHTPHFAKKMQQKPNRYIFLKDHTHWLMYDQNGRLFNQVLLEWLQETDENTVDSSKL